MDDSDPWNTGSTFNWPTHLNNQTAFDDDADSVPSATYFGQNLDLGDSWVSVQDEADESSFYDGTEAQAQEH